MKHTATHTAHGFFTEPIIARLAHETQESPAAISYALGQLVPLVVRALAARTNGPEGPETIWKLSREAYGANVLETVFTTGHADWMTRGEALMRGLLGETYHFTGLRMASAVGVRESTVHYLLNLTAVAALGAAGEYSQERGFDAASLAQWLRQQEGTLRHLLLDTGSQPVAAPETPVLPEIALAAAVGPEAGAGAWAPAGGGRTFTPPAGVGGSTGGGTQLWQWGLLLLTAVGLGYYFGRDTPAPSTGGTAVAALAAAPVTPVAAGPASGRYDANSDTYIYDTGQPLILRLADGTTQKVGANSTENRLYTFLADPAQQVDSVNRTKGWINFDRVYFETGQTSLTDESFQQLRNVSSILKTFPNSIVKIGGYTDSTGNALKNFQLSEERAKTAMIAIASMGVDINRIQAKGYGGKYFITPNTTPEGRALNRRISIRVIQK